MNIGIANQGSGSFEVRIPKFLRWPLTLAISGIVVVVLVMAAQNYLAAAGPQFTEDQQKAVHTAKTAMGVVVLSQTCDKNNLRNYMRFVMQTWAFEDASQAFDRKAALECFGTPGDAENVARSLQWLVDRLGSLGFKLTDGVIDWLVWYFVP